MVDDRRDSVLEHFRTGQLGRRSDLCSRELGEVLRSRSVAAPDFHPHVVAKALLQNLSQMTVGVYQARHDDHSRAVDSLCDRSSFCVDLPSDLGNGSVVNENLPRFENWFRGVQRDDGWQPVVYCDSHARRHKQTRLAQLHRRQLASGQPALNPKRRPGPFGPGARKTRYVRRVLSDLSGSAVQSPSLSFTREAEFAEVTAH